MSLFLSVAPSLSISLSFLTFQTEEVDSVHATMKTFGLYIDLSYSNTIQSRFFNRFIGKIIIKQTRALFFLFFSTSFALDNHSHCHYHRYTKTSTHFVVPTCFNVLVKSNSMHPCGKYGAQCNCIAVTNFYSKSIPSECISVKFVASNVH